MREKKYYQVQRLQVLQTFFCLYEDAAFLHLWLLSRVREISNACELPFCLFVLSETKVNFFFLIPEAIFVQFTKPSQNGAFLEIAASNSMACFLLLFM